MSDTLLPVVMWSFQSLEDSTCTKGKSNFEDFTPAGLSNEDMVFYRGHVFIFSLSVILKLNMR
jgi:hypothetical protein